MQGLYARGYAMVIAVVDPAMGNNHVRSMPSMSLIRTAICALFAASATSARLSMYVLVSCAVEPALLRSGAYV